MVKGINQEQMAERLHMSKRAYQNLENGVTKWDIERQQAVATELGIMMNDLLTNDESFYINQIINNQGGVSSKEVHIHSDNNDQIREIYEQRL